LRNAVPNHFQVLSGIHAGSFYLLRKECPAKVECCDFRRILPGA
jgi:hypothetical protein